MHRHRVGQLQLGHHVHRIIRYPVVVADFDPANAFIDEDDLSDIAVKHAYAVFLIVLFPYNIIIIFNLHDLIPQAEQVGKNFSLRLVRRRRVQPLL